MNKIKTLSLALLASFALIACSASNDNSGGYFGYSPAPQQEESAVVQETGNDDDQWVNPMAQGSSSDSYSTANGQQVVYVNNYYTVPQYVPVIAPWWARYYGWMSYPGPGVYVNYYWGDYCGYDWYSPWHRYDPYYGFYYDPYYYGYNHHGWYHRPIYSYYPEEKRIEKDTYRNFGSSRGRVTKVEGREGRRSSTSAPNRSTSVVYANAPSRTVFSGNSSASRNTGSATLNTAGDINAGGRTVRTSVSDNNSGQSYRNREALRGMPTGFEGTPSKNEPSNGTLSNPGKSGRESRTSGSVGSSPSSSPSYSPAPKSTEPSRTSGNSGSGRETRGGSTNTESGREKRSSKLEYTPSNIPAPGNSVLPSAGRFEEANSGAIQYKPSTSAPTPKSVPLNSNGSIRESINGGSVNTKPSYSPAPSRGASVSGSSPAVTRPSSSSDYKPSVMPSYTPAPAPAPKSEPVPSGRESKSSSSENSGSSRTSRTR